MKDKYRNIPLPKNTFDIMSKVYQRIVYLSLSLSDIPFAKGLYFILSVVTWKIRKLVSSLDLYIKSSPDIHGWRHFNQTDRLWGSLVEICNAAFSLMSLVLVTWLITSYCLFTYCLEITVSLLSFWKIYFAFSLPISLDFSLYYDFSLFQLSSSYYLDHV